MYLKLRRILAGYVLFAVVFAIAVSAELREDGPRLVAHIERYMY
jgi:hypothetical protein